MKKVDDDNESEDNLNFDASVWEVTKKNDEDKLVGLIYLPITGYSGYDSNSKTYMTRQDATIGHRHLAAMPQEEKLNPGHSRQHTTPSREAATGT